MFYAISGVLAVIGVILIVVGKTKGALKSTMASMPTSPINGLNQLDYVEIKGQTSCAAPIEAPYTDTPCIYYSYQLQRYERSRSSNSNKASWHTIDSGAERTPFELTDDTATISILPDGAKFDAQTVCRRNVDPSEFSGLDNMPDGPMKSIFNTISQFSGQRMRVSVKAILPGSDLYIIGDVQKSADGQLFIGKGEKKFFISSRSEEQLSKSLAWQSVLLYVLGAASIVGGGVVLAKFGLNLF